MYGSLFFWNKGEAVVKIVVYDVLANEKPILKMRAKQLGLDLIYHDGHLQEESLSLAAGADGISILGYSIVDRKVCRSMAQMGIRFLSTRTVGFDNIDVAAARECGIEVSNSRYMPANVADFTVMLMLMLLRKAKISICRALVNDFSLTGLQGREMRSITVGIIGTGSIGSTVIRSLSGFGCQIIAYSRHRDPALEGVVEYVSIKELYERADVISLHMALTKDNYHFIDKEAFSQMKDGVILINTARGALVDSEALIEALESEKVGGAGIDTLEEESGIAHVDVGINIIQQRSLLYLKQFPNVVYTQHYGFFTEEATASMIDCSLQALQAGFNGQQNPYKI